MKWLRKNPQLVGQNPKLKVWGLTLVVVGMLLSWWLGPGLASIVNITGIILAFTGIDTELTDNGVKIGFTRIRADEVTNLYEEPAGILVLATRSRHRYRMKKWHYKGSEWGRLKMHLAKVMKNAEQGIAPQPAARSESDFSPSLPPST